MSARERLAEHEGIRRLLLEVEEAAKAAASAENGASSRARARLRRAFADLALALFEHMAREEMTPELSSIARLHVEHAQQRTVLRAAVADLAEEDEARPLVDIAEEAAWLVGALRRDMEEEERSILDPAAASKPRAAIACKDVMRRPVRFVLETDPARTAAQTMLQANVGFVVVCDTERKPVGTLTDRDLAVRLVAESRSTDAAVGTIMSRTVVTCSEGEPVTVAERLMAKHRKARIVCLDGDGHVAGVISLSDLSQREEPGADARSADLLRQISRRQVRRRT